MKKLFGKSSIIYFLFMLVVAMILFTFSYFGYRFDVSFPVIWFVINLLVECAFMVICLAKGRAATKASFLFAQLLPLCALVYLYAIVTLVDGIPGILLILHGLFCFLSCFIIAVFSKGNRTFYVVSVSVNSIFLFLLVLLVLAALFIGTTFGKFGKTTIIKKVASPNPSYVALLIDSDQGALGGDTVVDIEYTLFEIKGLGRFVKTQRLYTGPWGEFDGMRLEWEDSNTLLINGSAYKIDEE